MAARERFTGTIRRIGGSGFGFVEPDNPSAVGADTVFLHLGRSVSGDLSRQLRLGDRVIFRLAGKCEGKYPEARSVELIACSSTMLEKRVSKTLERKNGASWAATRGVYKTGGGLPPNPAVVGASPDWGCLAGVSRCVPPFFQRNPDPVAKN